MRIASVGLSNSLWIQPSTTCPSAASVSSCRRPMRSWKHVRVCYDQRRDVDPWPSEEDLTKTYRLSIVDRRCNPSLLAS